jgi:hypothetical protein
VEIWVASLEKHELDPGYGPWSNCSEDTTGTLRVEIDGATFALKLRFRRNISASNRGRDTIDELALTGTVTVEPDGSRLLHANWRLVEQHEHHEPMEDMWTPPIDHVASLPAGALDAGERATFRIGSPDATTTRLEDAAGYFRRCQPAAFEWLAAPTLTRSAT